jgi:periplasmic protein TonB
MYRLSVLFLLLLVFCSPLLYSQNSNDGFITLDANWQSTTPDKAKYLVREVNKNDTCYRKDSYNLYGPLIKSESFKDKKGAVLNILHGKYASYDSEGRADSIGNYFNGKQDGTWYFYNAEGNVVKQKEYNGGALVSVKEVADKENPNDTESEYPGGAPAWQRYLNRNLRYPQRAIDNKKQGTVVVVFVVNTDGQTEDFTILKSLELSMDDETIRIFKNSNRWVPATKNDQNVRSYKKQPITYRME